MVQQIRPEALAEKLRAGEPFYLIDVRQPWEHDYCALPESVLIPLPELSDRDRADVGVEFSRLSSITGRIDLAAAIAEWPRWIAWNGEPTRAD